MTEQTTHLAVPVPIVAALLKLLGNMPHDQVNSLIVALGQCKPLSQHDEPTDPAAITRDP